MKLNSLLDLANDLRNAGITISEAKEVIWLLKRMKELARASWDKTTEEFMKVVEWSLNEG
ncbi:MAG: hypothetical protein QXU36_08500 [Thermofilum sp.]|uniref:hypothetical protein n=1 Tax=Thermofilum sp. TaxID=1961369 RepID=UPI0031690788